MLSALIMAGGKGERFWPMSTEEKPKQFLKLLGEDSMLQMTVKRLEAIIPLERIFIVTGNKYTNLVGEQLPFLPKQNIITEPVGKNTAPCIVLSALIIDKYFKNSSIVVLPSDHLIEDEEKFRQTILAGNSFVENNEDSIVTIGMKPDRPETGYGYIKLAMDNVKCAIDNFNIHEVERFVEKPDLQKAEEYISNGNYLWNGGMFIWKTETILKLAQRYLNRTYELLKNINDYSGKNFEDVLEYKYSQVESISIDYAIMEKADNIHVIPSDFGWDDVGSWYSVERYRPKDTNNNVGIGNINNINSKNNIIVSKDKKIVVAGLDSIFVVETDDMIFIGNKSNIENIKEIKSVVT